jgi:hypothetical protein
MIFCFSYIPVLTNTIIRLVGRTRDFLQCTFGRSGRPIAAVVYFSRESAPFVRRARRRHVVVSEVGAGVTCVRECMRA